MSGSARDFRGYFLTRPAELEPRQTLTFSRTITEPITSNEGSRPHIYFQAEEEEFIFAQKPNIKMNKHVNKVRKATGRAEAITAGRQ